MKYRNGVYLGVSLMLFSLILWGCPKSSEVTNTTGMQQENAAQSESNASGTAKDIKNTARKEGVGKSSKGLQSVYFDFDKAVIGNDEKVVMKSNADWLKANPKVKITIEGNCDDRGTKEYNQALGQRRSASAKKYLTDMGVASNRISIISYGKEKTVCNEQNEVCWQKNRRDDFVVLK